MTRILSLVIALGACAGVAAQSSDPWPKTVDEFRLAVQKVLDDTGVPGAGLALVRHSGVEWAGGVGLADRDRRTPVTADTHFRAGSISKTFIAMALVQLSEDGDLDLDTPMAEIASEVPFNNPWEAGDPVRVIHLLQHTAGFDDMHFNEVYNLQDPPDLPLIDVLRRNPRSRNVRWRPGTRVSYSNPGFAIAGYLVEKITGTPYEDFIAERTFAPIGMTTSSFRLTREDEALLAKGYRARTGPPVGYSQIYLRPAGNLHTSPIELGKFVHVLLNWGETTEQLVIDPEYLSNMEHPRSSLASAAGLRAGYGSAIAASTTEGFPMLGHGGGIDGFASLYAYSAARDVGYVVLLNSTHSPDAMRRISQLAVRYLKAEVAPPTRPSVTLTNDALRRFEGYYHKANPRNQSMAFLEWLLSGGSVTARPAGLHLDPVIGESEDLIPVADNLFRVDADAEATRVFAEDEAGAMVLTGGFGYSERRPRWLVEVVRWPVFFSFALALTPILMLVPWVAHATRANPSGFWWTKGVLILGSIALLLPVIGIMNVADVNLGTQNIWTTAMFAGTVLQPAAAILSLLFAIDAWRRGAGPWLRGYAVAVSTCACILTAYLSAWGMLPSRPWAF
ncbi:MAG: class A beta-lactamase-related serine hydrolase [Acidobacteria bacterium]|nr:class A beta-lactamase-related serine hydrolase [Acidobacteriota bacterium]